MLYVTIGNAIVYLLAVMGNNNDLYQLLCFDKALILQGQVWRLLTCVFTSVFSYGNILFVAVSLVCYFSLGRAIENTWGTFRFNLFYLFGLLLMDVFAMVLADVPVQIGNMTLVLSGFYGDMGSYLNMSLFIAYATLYPDSQFLLFFIIPVKAWIFALVDLALTLYYVAVYPFPHNLFPLVALANYFLFFGKDVVNVIPVTWRANTRRLFKKKKPGQKTGSIPFAGSYQAEHTTVKAPYTHRCTICGKTDVSHPELEFRYCSRCNGYFCYCEEHISNHQHIE
jgi:membrane associated rhomboid family serine protease